MSEWPATILMTLIMVGPWVLYLALAIRDQRMMAKDN